MKNYLLSHGFGFTNEYWKNITTMLNGNIYFLDDKNLDRSKLYIGIGHSIGFLKLNNSNLNFEYLVCLQGFLDFCGKTERMKAIRKQGLEKVAMEIKSDKSGNLAKFRLACGYDQVINEDLPLSDLLEDLNMMGKAYDHCGVRTLIIGSVEDMIVPMSIIEDNFKDIHNISIIKTTDIGHSLGYNKTNLVLEKMNEFNI